MSQQNASWCFHVQDDENKVDYFRVTFLACCVLNAIFAVGATISNGAIIIGIMRTPSLHTPSNLLFCGLAVSGLGIGLLTQPTYVVYKVAELNGDFTTICSIRKFHHFCTHFFSKLLLFILAEISVERFLGVHLLQVYRIVVSSKRVAIALVVAVVAAAIVAATTIVWKYNTANNVLHFALMFGCVLITTASYSIVYRKLKKQSKVRNKNNLLKQIKTDKAKKISVYKHSIQTVAWLIGSVLFCSLPQLCLLVVMEIIGYTDPVRIAQNVAATVLFMNATFNPLVWFYRNKGIQEATCKALGVFRNQRSENLQLNSFEATSNSCGINKDKQQKTLGGHY